MNSYSVKTIKTLSANEQHQLLELFAEADFAEFSEDTQWLADAVSNSVTAAAAFDSKGNLIGFARALGDQVSDCYIQDVAVRKEFRGNGIGKALVKHILQVLAEKNIDWVGLIATPGKADFYRKLGFEIMPEHTPMRLSPEKYEKYN